MRCIFHYFLKFYKPNNNNHHMKTRAGGFPVCYVTSSLMLNFLKFLINFAINPMRSFLRLWGVFWNIFCYSHDLSWRTVNMRPSGPPRQLPHPSEPTCSLPSAASSPSCSRPARLSRVLHHDVEAETVRAPNSEDGRTDTFCPIRTNRSDYLWSEVRCVSEFFPLLISRESLINFKRFDSALIN